MLCGVFRPQALQVIICAWEAACLAYLLGGYQSRVGLKVARRTLGQLRRQVKFGERDVNPNLVTLITQFPP